MIAQDLLEAGPVTLNEDASLEEVFALMRHHKIADYPVVDALMNYRGMLFEAGLLEKVYREAEKQKCGSFGTSFLESMKEDLRRMRVRDVMDPSARSFSSHEPVERIGAVMLFEKIPRVAVTDRGQVIGVISLSRILSSLMERLPHSHGGKKDAGEATAAGPEDLFKAEDPQNKRFFKRTPVAVPVAYRLIPENGKGSPEGKIAQTVNVSAGGLLILTREPLREGQSLNVALDIYQNNKPIRMTCRIVRCLPSKQQGTYEVGLIFVTIGVEERRQLLAHFDKGPA